MQIEAMQKLTLLDFPGKTAAILFTHGCNLRCPFCHNAGLVVRSSETCVDEEEILSFLKKRKGLLDGVVLTGGEPLLWPDAAELLQKIHALGYAVKLDTNGTFPERLRALVDSGLIDYVAMDIKNAPEKYAVTAGVEPKLLSGVRESVSFLLSGCVEYEFRTTVTGAFHTPEDFTSIGRWIAGANRYFLQPFRDSGDLVGHGDFAASDELMDACLAAVRSFVPSALRRDALQK